MCKRVSSGSERSYHRLERGRWKPSFGQAEKINFVVEYKGLKKFRLVVRLGDGRCRTNVEIGKDEVVCRRNRARIDFDVTRQKEHKDEELAGGTTGDLKFARGQDRRVEKKE